MKVIGLTGGIATGVSAVAKMFRELGATVIEADQVARDVVRPGTEVHKRIVEVFGRGVLQPDGAVDRKQLAEVIFRDAAARRRLNAITHPRIRQTISNEVERLREGSPDAVVIVDVPLLLDTTGPEAFGLEGVIVVYADPQTQVARIMKRDGLTEEEARRRIAAQRPVSEKVTEADWTINNNGSLDETRRQVEDIWRELTS